MRARAGGEGTDVPAADPTDSVDSLAWLTLREFGFAEGTVEEFERLPRGIMNHNYRVRASGEEWVLKCHRGSDVAGRRDATHRLELHLLARGLPVAHLRTPLSGGTYVETPAGLFTLHRWVPGCQISIADRAATHEGHPGLAGHLGELLGDLHRTAGALADLPGPELESGQMLRGPLAAVGSIRHGPPGRFRKVPALRLRRGKSDFDRWVLARLPVLFEAAAGLADPSVAALVDPDDVVLDHNDLNWENLVLDDSVHVRAVLDLDNAAWVPRVMAVGAAAAVLVGPEPDRLDRFLDAYERVAGVSVDRRGVLVGMHAKCLRSTLRSIDLYLSGRVVDTTMLAPWCEHLDQCREALPALPRS